ncbi:MAG: energy-coupling factor ABC transporter ATP-binding protein [Bifidobacteriaceae bacterium]|jgi:energy-coupling factor transport system ATP-binding protein|nr:energy-coupling factor ABC transporter ATP-binding protein [Bifidobacteriaceae bacterium]
MDLAKLTDVTFTYAYSEEPALRGVSASLERGLIYGVVGANGAGKTTFTQLLRGIVPFFHEGELSGRVEVLGKDLAAWDRTELSTTVGCVFDNPFTQISGIKETVFEEIAFGLENLGWSRTDIFQRVQEVTAMLSLEPLGAKNPRQLSGGQRQKVAFAAIVAMDPSVYVIDEPTSQLDPATTEDVFDIILGLRKRGKSVVLAENNIDQLARVADRIIVLERGTVVAEGTVADVLAGPIPAAASIPYPELAEIWRTAGLEGAAPLTKQEYIDRCPILGDSKGGGDEH